jgi:hypothetical protein
MLINLDILKRKLPTNNHKGTISFAISFVCLY